MIHNISEKEREGGAADISSRELEKGFSDNSSKRKQIEKVSSASGTKKGGAGLQFHSNWGREGSSRAKLGGESLTNPGKKGGLVFLPRVAGGGSQICKDF